MKVGKERLAYAWPRGAKVKLPVREAESLIDAGEAIECTATGAVTAEEWAKDPPLHVRPDRRRVGTFVKPKGQKKA